MAHAAVTTFRNRQAVSLSNDEIELMYCTWWWSFGII